MKNGRSTRCLALLLAFALCSGLVGCGGGSTVRRTEDGRVVLRVSMYNSSSYPLWRAYVEEHCPDVFIEWENNRNTAANVLYLAEHDDMPDIVSIRRFESDTTAQLRPYLADLSALAVTKTYGQQYLAPFAADGKQYWLPGPGVIDGIVADTDLFTQYGIALPTDMDSFLEACAQLEAHDVAVFAADCAEPWSPTQLLEGFGAAALADYSGDWVQRFENNDADAVDTAAFSRIAAALRLLCEHRILTQQDLDSTAAETSNMLISGKAAMVRKASDEKFDAAGSHHYAALPFFGASAADDRLCTYPVFSLAMSNRLEKDPALRAAGEEVLGVMLSRGAQETLNASGEGLISYNTGVELPLSDSMRNVKGLIDSGKCFIRVLNADSFAANSKALTALVRDGADDAAFVDILNRELFREPDDTTVAVSGVEASNELDSARCCPSGSVVAQVLQKQTGSDCALLDVRETPTTIFKGSYSRADVNAVVLSDSVYTGTLTPEQLLSLLDTAVLCATTFQNGQVEPLLEYPAAAGMTIRMQSDGTILGVTLSGQSAGWTSCRVAVSENIYKALVSQASPLAQRFSPAEKTLQQYFLEGFGQAKGLPEPQNYFQVQ